MLYENIFVANFLVQNLFSYSNYILTSHLVMRKFEENKIKRKN